MAPAHQVRPDEIGGLLVAGENGVPAAHVLVETQLTAGPQYPAEFGKRGRHVRHGAQQPGHDNRVEHAVGGGQVPRGAVGHPDRDGRGRAASVARARRYGSGSTATTSRTARG